VTTSTTTNLTTSTTTISTTTTTQQVVENQTTTIPTETVPVESDSVVEVSSTYPITEYERILLCNIVANESGSDWISIYDKACVVACVMNRVNDSRFPNSIEEVLTQPYQFSGYYASDCYYPTVTDACIQAVDYYFEHSNEFGNYLYFEGNGTNNVFH
jgi:spore germination cell wall hydrolase CwlJ-like protein